MANSDVPGNITILPTVPYHRPPTASELAQWYITAFSTPVILTTGVVGNVLSFMVFSKKSLRQSVSSFLFRILAVFDLLSLAEITENLFLYWDVDTLQRSDLTCRVCFYFIWVVKTTAAWLLVFISLERCIGVNLPLLAKTIVTRCRVTMATGLTLVSAMAIYGPFLVVYKMQMRYNAVRGKFVPYCSRPAGSIPLYKHLSPIFEMVLYSAAPFACILALNVAIVVRLVASRRFRRESVRAGACAAGNATAMLLTTSGAFVLLTLPFCVYYVMRDYLVTDPTHPWYIPLRPFKAAALILQQANHAINFLLYCLSGPQFRKELRAMFQGKNDFELSTSSNEV